MMRTLRICLLLLGFSSAPATSLEPDRTDPVPDQTEIRLGSPSTASPDQVRAVEAFLAARQDGSIDPSLAGRARARLSLHGPVETETLFGPPGSTLAAFDFRDDSIRPIESGGFDVAVYVLFADSDGRVVESRDERLTFAGGVDYACRELLTTNRIAWRQDGVRHLAKELGAARALDRIEQHLREWTRERMRLGSYSLADVRKAQGGALRVECLRFQAVPGRRGFHVDASPIHLYRSGSGDSIRVESN